MRKSGTTRAFARAALAVVLVATGLFASTSAPSRGATSSFATERVSVSTTGAQVSGLGGALAGARSTSADGRLVVFSSRAPNLVPGDTNDDSDVFIRDRLLNRTERLSVGTNGAQAVAADAGSISNDGRYLAFRGVFDPSGDRGCYVRDIAAATTVRIVLENHVCESPLISGTGRFVLLKSFIQGSNNLQVLVHDRQTGSNELVTKTSQGSISNATIDEIGDTSDDGRFVAFSSNGSDLVPGDTNNATDVFVRDRELGVTKRISVTSEGQEMPNGGTSPSMSSDGQLVSYLVSGVFPHTLNNAVQDVVVVDRPALMAGQTGSIVWASGSDIRRASSSRPRLSLNGGFVSFSNPQPRDPERGGFFMRTILQEPLRVGPLHYASETIDGLAPPGGTSFNNGSVSDSGHVVFSSDGPTFVEGDTNATNDVFVNSPAAGGLALTADKTSVGSSPPRAPVDSLELYAKGSSDAPLENRPPEASILGSLRLKLSPLGSLRLKLSPLLGSLRLKLSPLLGSLRLKLSPILEPAFSKIPLSSTPLADGRSWDDVLANTPLAGVPPQHLTWLDLLKLGNGTPDLVLRDLDLSTSPLGRLSTAGMLLGETRLAQITLPGDGWCPRLEALGHTPQSLGFTDCAELLSELTVQTLELAGIDIDAFPLAGVTLADIDLSNSFVPAAALEAQTIARTPMAFVRVVDIPQESRERVLHCGVTDGTSIVDCSPQSTQLLHEVDFGIRDGATFADLGTATDPIFLAELVVGFLSDDERPWEDIPLGRSGLNDYDGEGSTKVGYTATFTNESTFPVDAPAIQVVLPPSFRYIDGSSTAGEPERADSILTFHPTGQVDPGAIVEVGFRARPGTRLGVHASSVSISSPVAITHGGQAPVRVIESGSGDVSCEPNDDPTTAPQLLQDALYSCFLANANDIDYFRIPAQPDGARVQVSLRNPTSVDYDLVVYDAVGSAAPRALRGTSPVTRVNGDHVATQPGWRMPVDDGGAQAAGESEADQSVPLLDRAIAGAGTFRGQMNEFVEATSRGGEMLVQVSGANGASSDQAYVLRLRVLDAVDRECAARPYTPSYSGDASGLPSIPENAKTLIITSTDRARAIEGDAAATDGRAALSRLASDGNVEGVVLEVDRDPAVRAAYQAWDAHPCDVDAANDVVRAINDAVDAQLSAAHESLRYVVVAGNEEVVPFALLADRVQIANERTYAPELAFAGEDNATWAASDAAFVRSDDPYGDLNPQRFLGDFQYVPDLAIGRLGEHGDIGQAVVQFVDSAGRLQPSTALVSGYDFMTDGAHAVKREMEASLGASAVSTLIGPDWNANDLRDVTIDADPPPDVTSLQMHADHGKAISAAGHGNGAQNSVIRASNVVGKQLDGTLMFSMACHSGLAVPDVIVGNGENAARALDWPQAFTGAGAAYMGPTGYGYGDGDSVALSERLLQLFAKQLREPGATVGGALQAAKQLYVAQSGVYGVYDHKVVSEMSFWGLPMYGAGLSGTGEAAAARSEPASFSSSEPDGESEVMFAAAATSDDHGFALASSSGPPIDPATGLRARDHVVTPDHDKVTVTRGSFYASSGDTQVTHYRPIQPRTVLDVSEAEHEVAGAVITSMRTTEESGFDPVNALPIEDTDRAAEPEFDGVFPSTLVTVGSASTPSGTHDFLVLNSGQFDATEQNGNGVQRLIDSADVTAYYGDASEDAPVVRVADAFGDASSITFSATVTPGAKRVVALFREIGSGDWRSTDLSRSTSTTWTGTATGVDGEIEFVMQAVGPTGRVGVNSDKGGGIRSRVAGASDEFISTIVGEQGSNGWYLGDVSVQLEAADGLALEYSLDGSPYATYESPVPVGGSGQHVFDVRTPDGAITSIPIRIDATDPSVTIDAPSGVYLRGSDAHASFRCTDDASGVASCTASQSGHDVSQDGVVDTGSRGTKTIDVHAVDRSGRENAASASYVVAERASAPAVTATGTANAILLNWSPPSDDGGSDVTGYRIFRGLDPDELFPLADVEGTSYNDADPPPRLVYYAVAALTGVGEGLRGAVSINAIPRPGAPSSLTANPGTKNRTIELRWNAPATGGPVEVYQIYRRTSSGNLVRIAQTTSRTYVDSGLTAGQWYVYAVSAINAAGEGPRSNEAATRATLGNSLVTSLLTTVLCLVLRC